MRASGTFSLLTSLSHVLLTPGDGAPRKCRASPQSSLLTGGGTLRVLIDPRAMDTRGLTPLLYSSPLLWETKTAPIVGISSKPQLVSVFECTPFFVYVLSGTRHSQTSVTVQRDISPIDHLEKLARQAQQLASGKGKQNCWFCKKRNLWFGPNNNPVLPETQKCVLLTTGHALPHWSADKMKSLMNKYWGEY